MLLIELVLSVFKRILLFPRIIYIAIFLFPLIIILFLYSEHLSDYSLNNRYFADSKTINSPTLFCFILTSPKNFYHKATAVYKTWANKCDGLRFISVIPKQYLNEETKYFKQNSENVSIEVDHPFPILQPAGHRNEVYKKLTDKVYLTLIDIHNRHNKYDWYLKADDDTYVFVDYLREFVANKNSSVASRFGYNLKRWQSGGAGYLLSNKALNEIGNKLKLNYQFCPNKGNNLYFMLGL